MGTVKRGSLFGLLFLILTVLMTAGVSGAAGDLKLRITQVESNLPDLKLFLQLDNFTLSNSQLKKNLSIKINDTPVQITDIQPVRTGNRVTENTAYLILVDSAAAWQGYFPEVQSLLEDLFGLVSAGDRMAVFAVSTKLQPVKDFQGNDSIEQVTKALQKALAPDAGAESCLYSGIREAYDRGRAAPDIPSRRVIVLVSDGGAAGDCLSCADLEDYLAVDGLPVYTLILDRQAPADEDFKKAAAQIAEKTGGQSFVSLQGNELFARFKASMENGRVLKLRCANFKPLNLQVKLTVSWLGDEEEIRATAGFTAAPAAENGGELNHEQNLRRSYYGVMVILLPMILALLIFLALGWVLMTKEDQSP